MQRKTGSRTILNIDRLIETIKETSTRFDVDVKSLEDMSYIDQLKTHACVGNQIMIGVRGAGTVFGGYLMGSRKYASRAGWLEWDLPKFREKANRDNIGPAQHNPNVKVIVRNLEMNDLERPKPPSKYAQNCAEGKCFPLFHDIRLSEKRLTQLRQDLKAIEEFIVADVLEPSKPTWS